MLCRKDVLVTVIAVLGVRWSGRGGDEGKAARAGRPICIVAAPTAPVQSDTVVARLAVLGAVGADRLLLTALDLSRFCSRISCQLQYALLYMDLDLLIF